MQTYLASLTYPRGAASDDVVMALGQCGPAEILRRPSSSGTRPVYEIWCLVSSDKWNGMLIAHYAWGGLIHRDPNLPCAHSTTMLPEVDGDTERDVTMLVATDQFRPGIEVLPRSAPRAATLSD